MRGAHGGDRVVEAPLLHRLLNGLGQAPVAGRGPQPGVGGPSPSAEVEQRTRARREDPGSEHIIERGGARPLFELVEELPRVERLPCSQRGGRGVRRGAVVGGSTSRRALDDRPEAILADPFGERVDEGP